MTRRCSRCHNNGRNSRSCTTRLCGVDVAQASKRPANRKKMMKQQKRNWLDLPSDVMANILNRIGMVDILENAQKVCTVWRKISEDPAMWRVINMNDILDSALKQPPTDICRLTVSSITERYFDIKSLSSAAKLSITNMCKRAVDRSQGQLVDITLAYDFNVDILQYVADRSSQLRRLELVSTFDERLSRDALIKFPMLEELNLYSINLSKEDIESVGRHCPKLKTLKLNRRAYALGVKNIDENLAKAIGQNLVELRHLELIGNIMTNGGLQAILDNCHHLQTLDLRACFNIDLNGDLRKRCFRQIKYLKLPNDSLEGCSYIYQDSYQVIRLSQVCSPMACL